jgi:hypothetical protein
LSPLKLAPIPMQPGAPQEVLFEGDKKRVQIFSTSFDFSLEPAQMDSRGFSKNRAAILLSRTF